MQGIQEANLKDYFNCLVHIITLPLGKSAGQILPLCCNTFFASAISNLIILYYIIYKLDLKLKANGYKFPGNF